MVHRKLVLDVNMFRMFCHHLTLMIFNAQSFISLDQYIKQMLGLLNFDYPLTKMVGLMNPENPLHTKCEISKITV